MTMKSRLHFTEAGNGDVTLIFLHYFGGSANTWHKVIDQLHAQFRCIAIDLPGFGDSQGDFTTLSVNFCATEVAQVIKISGVKQYVLVGHSMGGKIALALASMQLPGLLSIILVAPSPPTPEPMTDHARTQLLNAYGNRQALEKLINTITATPLAKPEMESAIIDHLKISRQSWNWWIQLGSRENISSQLSAITVPVLIVSGGFDPNFSGSFLQKEIRPWLPSAKFEEILNVGHLLPLEASLNLAQLIRNFLMLS